jgi:hypothetical protein
MIGVEYFRSIHQRGPVAERLVATGSQVIVPLQWITEIWALFRLPFARASLVVVPSPKRPRPRSESSEMSNKIAQVSLDFSGGARMCAGSKGVGADGPAVS